MMDELGVPRAGAATRLLIKSLQLLFAGGALVLVIVAATSGAPVRPWQVIVIALLAYVSGAIAGYGLASGSEALMGTSSPDSRRRA